MVCLRHPSVIGSSGRCGEPELLQVSQIVGGHEPNTRHPSSVSQHPKHTSLSQTTQIHLVTVYAARTYRINTHNGFTRTLDAGTPPGRRRSLHSRHDPSQLPELSTLARSTGWSHACPQACWRFPWRVWCLFSFFSSTQSPSGLCSFNLPTSLPLLTCLHCRVHTKLIR